MTVELKSWRQIYLNSYFRIPSVYWEIIKCVSDILCQNIVKIHTILYQTLQTKQLCLCSSLSYFTNKINIKLRISFWMKLAKNIHFWMHYNFASSVLTSETLFSLSNLQENIELIMKINNEVTHLKSTLQYSHELSFSCPCPEWWSLSDRKSPEEDFKIPVSLRQSDEYFILSQICIWCQRLLQSFHPIVHTKCVQSWLQQNLIPHFQKSAECSAGAGRRGRARTRPTWTSTTRSRSGWPPRWWSPSSSTLRWSIETIVKMLCL